MLDVPISFFFDDMPDTSGNGHGSTHVAGFSERSEFGGPVDDPLAKRETLELVRAYYRITDPSVRKRVFDLIKSMGPADLPV